MTVKMIGLAPVQAKLLLAAPRILEENRLMVSSMLGMVKSETEANTPLGPGRWGDHLRDKFTTDVQSSGTKTIGVLKAPVRGLWREKGTKRGERRFWTAHKALSLTKRFIKFYYNGAAQWWRL